MFKRILTVRNLNVYCPSAYEENDERLLYNIDLDVLENDRIGIVGETGAGKSILIDSIGRNIRPPLRFEADKLTLISESGSEDKNILGLNENELSSVWGQGIAFIPPNARDRLNPILTIGKQFSNIVMAHKRVTPKEAYQIVVDMFRKVQMPDPEQNYNSYPHELSGGMAQRVVVSIAFFMSPKLLLADEPTMGLDVTIQKQVLDLMVNLLSTRNASVILSTRDLGIVANYCSKVVVMCNGKIVEHANVEDFFKKAGHPYSQYLLEAAFASHGMKSQVDSSQVATKKDIMIRDDYLCPFLRRCILAKDKKNKCWTDEPPLITIENNHYVKCHKWEELNIGRHHSRA